MDIKSTVRSLEEVNFQIKRSLEEIECLASEKQSLEEEKQRKLKEALDAKDKLKVEQFSYQNSSNRGEELLKKYSAINEAITEDANKLNDECREFFDLLDVQVSVKRASTLSEVKLTFLKRLDCYVIFIYDPKTDDLDLYDMNPGNEKLESAREFLRSNGDVQGFLSNFRKYLLKDNVLDKIE